jgi:hypothetical protein
LFSVSGRAQILSKPPVIKKQPIKKKKNPNLLESVLYENGFHFFTALETYTGITATSTVEFRERVDIIPIQSVMFHFDRQDFQKWFKNTIGDEELAKKISQIDAKLQDENLRKELSKVVQSRISELKQHP